MATQFDLHCADVLFVGGAFDKAKVLYLEILETISPAGTGHSSHACRSLARSLYIIYYMH